MNDEIFLVNYKKIVLAVVILFVLISATTVYLGTTDITEYASVAKYFAGKYPAEIRSSHSLFFGWFHSPLFFIWNNLSIIKIANIFYSLLIVASLYFMSNKNKKILLLSLFSPILWYMGPWINPIQIASLLFLWGYFFLHQYQTQYKDIKFLFYAGILCGLSAIFWNTVLFIVPFLLVFFYDKKLKTSLFFIASFIIGLIPLFIMDELFYKFPFYSIIKFISANAIVFLYGGIYPTLNNLLNPLLNYLILFLFFFSFTYFLLSGEIFSNNRRDLIFLLLSFLFFFINPQARYLLLLWPIAILILSQNNHSFDRTHYLFFLLVASLVVVLPYLIQIKYSTNSPEFSSFIYNFGSWKISSTSAEKLMSQDLQKISFAYPNETFVVGPNADDYATLALLYWGKNVKEFVSIEDYKLHFQNESTIFEKKIIFTPKIKDRRQIWIGGGLQKNENDDTAYEKIKFAIGVGEPIKLDNFAVVKKYNVLYLSEKIG